MHRLLRFTFFLLFASAVTGATPDRPNVIVILADDLGYGDLGCYNPASRISTPHLDRLAVEGIRFTDAHSPSAVCTPTRYALLTGRYAWRTWLKSGVLDGFDPPLLEAGRPTLASWLKDLDYATACIGKWHLGMTWTAQDGSAVPYRGTGTTGFRAGRDIDYTRDTQGGPLDRGFDVFFGISASLDMSPYAYIEGRRTEPPPSRDTAEQKDLLLNQVAGVTAAGFELDGVLPTLMQRAADYVRGRKDQGQPFFLYVPLTSPHLPVTPSPQWAGRSGIGPYGDFVMETDHEVGRLLTALEESGQARDTLVIFTSDNGGLWHAWEARETDDRAGYQPTPRARQTAAAGHHSNAHLRGTKADIYEGGHRVPFLVRWPARIQGGRVSDALVELNDIFATLAELTGARLPEDAAEDSFSFAAVLRNGPAAPLWPRRTFGVHHSLHGVFALREGDWKLVPARGSGGFSQPRTVVPKDGEPAGQLYHLGGDPSETRNLWDEKPTVVARMAERLRAIQQGTQTRPAKR